LWPDCASNSLLSSTKALAGSHAAQHNVRSAACAFEIPPNTEAEAIRPAPAIDFRNFDFILFLPSHAVFIPAALFVVVKDQNSISFRFKLSLKLLIGDEKQRPSTYLLLNCCFLLKASKI
jgi:hypothetical protein